MIADRLENLGFYFAGARMNCVRRFLKELTPELSGGRHDIDGNMAFALVSRYETKRPEDAAMESHLRYMDIQVLIAGREGIAWHPVDGLDIETPYDPVRDVMFYLKTALMPGRIDISPGMFVALLPADAHMPQLAVGAPAGVVKVVVKVDLEMILKY